MQGVLRRIISRRMVEPQRRFFDLHRLYMNKHIARVSTQQAWLRCRMSLAELPAQHSVTVQASKQHYACRCCQ